MLFPENMGKKLAESVPQVLLEELGHTVAIANFDVGSVSRELLLFFSRINELRPFHN